MKLTPFSVTLTVAAVTWVIALAACLGTWAYYEQRLTSGYPTLPMYQDTDWAKLAEEASPSASLSQEN